MSGFGLSSTSPCQSSLNVLQPFALHALIFIENSVDRFIPDKVKLFALHSDIIPVSQDVSVSVSHAPVLHEISHIVRVSLFSVLVRLLNQQFSTASHSIPPTHSQLENMYL